MCSAFPAQLTAPEQCLLLLWALTILVIRVCELSPPLRNSLMAFLFLSCPLLTFFFFSLLAFCFSSCSIAKEKTKNGHL